MNDDDHPLFRHFHALSAALDHQLAQSHHHARAASRAQSQSHLLSRQLAILNHELTTLRAQASSLPSSTESSLKINQLSLALRALNKKLELTERLLLERTRRLDHASADASAARSAMDSAYDLAARIRTREQELLDHQADLQTKLRLEQAKSSLNERVIQDYADLVRKLEGRQSSNPKDEQPTALERLGEDFRSSTTHLQHQLSSSQHDLSILQTQLDAQTEINKDLISRLSQLQVEIDKRERDDNTASKMVSRYMSVTVTPLSIPYP
jgi:chromosome segregation ATPase